MLSARWRQRRPIYSSMFVGSHYLSVCRNFRSDTIFARDYCEFLIAREYHILHTLTVAVSECCWHNICWKWCSAFFIWWRKILVTFPNPSFFRRRFVSSSANEWGKTHRYYDAKYTRTRTRGHTHTHTHGQLFESTNPEHKYSISLQGTQPSNVSSHAATPKLNGSRAKCRNIAWHGVVRSIWRLTFVNAPRTHSHTKNYTISVKWRSFDFFFFYILLAPKIAFTFFLPT